MPEESKPTHKRRLAIFLGLAAAMLIAIAIFYFKDDPLDDHSDLVPSPPSIEDGEAALAAWFAATGKCDDAPWQAITDLRAFFDSLEGNAAWDAANVEKILNANRDALDLAAKADALGQFVMPQMQRIDESVPYFAEFQSLSKNLKVLALERAHAGEFAAARDAALINLRLGDHMAEGNGALIGYLVGITVEAISYSAIDRIARDGRAPDEVLVALADALADEPDLAAAYQHSLRVEFSLIADILDRIDELGSIGLMGGKSAPSFLLRRDRTINQAAAIYRAAIANAALPPGKRTAAVPPVPPKGLAMLSSNALGRQLIADIIPITDQLGDKADHNIAQRRAIRACIALRRYQKSEGKLPPALADLVPRYLDAVPADPFDGKPLRYDAARGAVWVLGKDLTDGGGAPSPTAAGTFHRAADPTLFVTDDPPPAATP